MATPYYNAEAPIIVQGQVVNTDGNYNGQKLVGTAWSKNNHLIQASTYNHTTDDDVGWTKGEQQPRHFRDVFWAVLFYVHLIAVGFATIKYAPLMAEDLAEGYTSGAQNRRLFSMTRLLEDGEGNNDDDVDMGTIGIILAASGLAGFLISSLAMAFMMKFAEGLIKASLFFNLLVFGGMTVFLLSTGVYQLAILSVLGFLVSVYYVFVVWKRIPFAASNLVTAITATRANMGLAFFAYTNLFISFLWSVWWAIAFVGTSYVLGDCDAEANCESEVNGGLVFLFLVSYFWTAQVVKNVVHVTVAGTVSTWWFTPVEAASCCSQGVRNSYVRSITTSFGSICLGSLIVAIIQAVKEILHSMRQQNDSILVCFAECLMGCLESLMEYFNQWAFVFVGVYGYSFMEAGRNVMALFKSRGWTAIIADFLVDTVLLMVSLAVGVLTGLVGLAIGSMINLGDTTLAGAFM